jgi:hypothetical protein
MMAIEPLDLAGCGDYSDGVNLPQICRPRNYLSLMLLALAACGAHSSSSSVDTQALTGSERFAWDQPAANRSELSEFHYAVYVDGTRHPAGDVVCGTTPSSAGFPCTCKLPQMSSGPHTLEVAAFITDAGAVKESSRSPAVKVTMR